MEKLDFLDRDFFQTIINSSSNGLIVVDSDGILVFYNQAAKKVLQKDFLQLGGKHISMASKEIWEDHKGIFSTGKPQLCKKISLNGQVMIVNLNPIRKDGKIVGILGIIQDLPKFEQITSELTTYRAMVNEMDDIFEALYDGLLITDGDGRVLRTNSSWEKISGFHNDDVIGKKVTELENEGYCSKSAALMAIEQKDTLNIQYKLSTGREVLSSATPIFGDDGNVSMVVVNVRDLTDIRRLTQQLEKSKKLTEKYQSKLKELKTQIFKHDDIIAESKSMKEVLDLAMRVANVDASVLITGETGVGKEVVAKFIHNHSERRSKGLFLTINCGAIPENLLETELFGYESGAFTGASSGGKPGLFEAAEGGTIILDEIGELSLNLQVKLLSAIQEREITRVGAVKSKKIDIRVIAITNRDLKKMTEDGTFRKDLYFRLNVVPIYISSLRERKDDILHLINFFLGKFNLAYNKNVYLSRVVIDHLISYEWPGNIRELSNIIERLVVVISHDEIVSEDLPDNLRGGVSGFTIGRFECLKDAVTQVEMRLMQEAIKKYGSVQQAALQLKMNPSTIYRKLKNAKLPR